MRFSFFLLLLALCLPARAQIGAMAGKGSARAVIIGISDYEDERIPSLKFAHRDAMAMAEFLQSAAGGNIPSDNIRMLLNGQATRGEIAMALYWLVEQSKAGDRAIIYFSGHGDLENKIMMDQGYLLAYDAKAVNYMGSGTYPVEMLQKVIQTLSVRLDVEVILITDACRAGKLAGSETGGVVATNEGLARAFNNEIRILSCEPNQFSLEGEQWGGGRGLFSYFLIDGLKGLADERSNKNLKVELRELESFLKDEVSKRADQYPMTRGPGSSELFRVDEDTLLALLERQKIKEENMAFATPRSTLPTAGDTVIHPLYQQFERALAEGHLLYPEAGSAYALFQQMQQVAPLQPLLSAQRLNLAAALQDDAQQAINAYLEASPEEMSRRWQYDPSYQYYPEYLDKAAELVGAGNFLYDDLKARQAYFEGLALRLRGELMPNKDSILQLAIRKQEQSLSIDSLAPHVYNELGLAYLRLKNYRKALEYFEQAHELSPGWVVPVGNISTAQLEMARYDEAATTAEQALELREDYVPPRYNLAKIAYKQGDYQRTAELAEASIAFDSNYTYAYFILGLAREAQNRMDKAKGAYLKAYQLNPKDALTNNKLGYLAQINGQPAEAASYYQAALQYHPYMSEPTYNLGFIYLADLPNYAESEKYFRKYVQLKPGDMEGFVLLACALSLQGDQDQALEWLEQALEGGFSAFDDLRSTPFLQGLQPDPRFAALLSRYEN
ncbi:MAG: tetratricopeptide repeat protein [Phaeodactylibacter sp.]|nr:tetratricopeptide repeat protein [Phaeodactylibacter sp.]